MASEYFIKLDRFEGPLDLLLHLVKVHEIDIFSIDILRLTTEYLNYLRLVGFEDLNDAGEFLAMAATMIEIKSRSLLPQEEKNIKDDGVEEDDPVKLLQERLLQYEAIRNASAYLASLPQVGVEIQTNHESSRLATLFAEVETPIAGDPITLVIMFEQLLQNLAERKHTRVQATTHLITLEQTIATLEQYIETVRYTMFQSFYHRFTSRYDFVVYFMAALELSKMHKVKIYQHDLLGPLWVYKADMEIDALPLGGQVQECHGLVEVVNL